MENSNKENQFPSPYEYRLASSTPKDKQVSNNHNSHARQSSYQGGRQNNSQQIQQQQSLYPGYDDQNHSSGDVTSHHGSLQRHGFYKENEAEPSWGVESGDVPHIAEGESDEEDRKEGERRRRRRRRGVRFEEREEGEVSRRRSSEDRSRNSSLSQDWSKENRPQFWSSVDEYSGDYYNYLRPNSVRGRPSQAYYPRSLDSQLDLALGIGGNGYEGSTGSRGEEGYYSKTTRDAGWERRGRGPERDGACMRRERDRRGLHEREPQTPRSHCPYPYHPHHLYPEPPVYEVDPRYAPGNQQFPPYPPGYYFYDHRLPPSHLLHQYFKDPHGPYTSAHCYLWLEIMRHSRPHEYANWYRKIYGHSTVPHLGVAAGSRSIMADIPDISSILLEDRAYHRNPAGDSVPVPLSPQIIPKELSNNSNFTTEEGIATRGPIPTPPLGICVPEFSEKYLSKKFLEYLLSGNNRDALEWAIKHGLWGHAMFLAHRIGGRMLGLVLTRFANNLPHDDPLQKFYQLLSRRQPAPINIVWDSEKKQWMDMVNDEDENAADLQSPGKALELIPTISQSSGSIDSIPHSIEKSLPEN